MLNMKKYITLVVISCLMICLIGIVVWVWPQPINTSLTMYNYEGDASIEVKLDGTLHRHLMKEKELRGKLVIDGVEYFNLEGVQNYFAIPADYAPDRLKSTALVSFSDDSFEDISIGLVRDENFESYQLQW